MTFPGIIGLRHAGWSVDALCRRNLGALARELGLIGNAYDLEAAAFAPLYSGHPEFRHANPAGLLKSYRRIVLFSFSRALQGNLERITRSPVSRIPPRPQPQDRIHVGRFLWDSLAAAGLLRQALPSSPLPTAPQIEAPQRICAPGALPVLIHPGSGSRQKNWPLESFVRLEKLLRADGLKIEYILGPAESCLRKNLAAGPAAGAPVHIVGDLRDVLSLMKNSCAFIGNDSGLSHLAAFIGLPVTVVFGPSDPMRWKPPGPAVTVVAPASDCPPCHETGNRSCSARECFKTVSPHRVHAAFAALQSKL